MTTILAIALVSAWIGCIFWVLVAALLHRMAQDDDTPDEVWTPPGGCWAQQKSDSMVCERCQQTWDMNDPYPPNCDRAENG